MARKKRQLAFIKRAKLLGLSLGEIKELTDKIDEHCRGEVVGHLKEVLEPVCRKPRNGWLNCSSSGRVSSVITGLSSKSTWERLVKESLCLEI